METTINFLKKQWINLLTFFIVLFGLIYGLFFGTVIINGSSMEPSFTSGDVVVIRTDNDKIQPGDTVTIDGEKLSELHGGQFEDMIKRVIATPGQKVTIVDNEVYIDEVKLEEDYIREPMEGNMNIEVTLGEDEFFVMGDNRNYSLDSRVYGPVTRDMIDGYTLFNIRNAE